LPAARSSKTFTNLEPVAEQISIQDILLLGAAANTRETDGASAANKIAMQAIHAASRCVD